MTPYDRTKAFLDVRAVNAMVKTEMSSIVTCAGVRMDILREYRFGHQYSTQFVHATPIPTH